MIYWLHLLATTCQPKGSVFGFPTWYKYLEGDTPNPAPLGIPSCIVRINSINDIWLIVAAVIEILLRLAALAAIVFVVVGGVRYIVSQGEPDKTAQARSTIINALIGLVIAVGAATIISFIAGKFK